MTTTADARPVGTKRTRDAYQRKPEFVLTPTAIPGSLQTRLQQRHPRAVGRHAWRTFIRGGVLITGDLVAGAFAALVQATANEYAVDHGLLTHAYSPGARFVVLSLIFGLLTTGSYRRRSPAYAQVSLIRGCFLASVLVAAGAAQVEPLGRVLPSLVLVFLTAWGSVSGARYLSAKVAGRLLAGSRLAIRAVVVGFPTSTVPGEEEFAPRERTYRVLGHVSTSKHFGTSLGQLADLPRVIDQQQIEAVIVPRALPDAQLQQVLDACLTAGCECLYSARIIEPNGVRPSLVWRGEEPFFEFGMPVLRAQQNIVKRCIDIIGAAVLLVLAAPVMLVIALAIMSDSSGSVFFSQHRAGLGGKRFRMLKFRTMRVGADAEKHALAHLNFTGDPRLFKIPDDPRVTRVGAWLRRWSLDELPQILNVIAGDMSLVGPRPFFESDLEDYEVHHFRRLAAKPGLTGLWQVSGRSNVVDFEEVVRLDRQYIERWSIWLDLIVLLRTVPAVFRKSGAF